MISRPDIVGARGLGRVVRAAIALCAVCVALSALAQDAPPANSDQKPSSTSPGQSSTGGPSLFPLTPPPLPNLDPPPGVETFGRWLEQGTTRFKSELQGAQETFDKLGTQTLDAAKDATGAVVALPNARVVVARERCALAQNGSADCQAAAEALCRGKGFQNGKSLDTQSELKCPAKLLLERRAPNDKDCLTEIFITRAMCQ
jgi:hypothetical protein